MSSVGAPRHDPAPIGASALRKIPSVDEVVRHTTLVQAKERFGHAAVVATVRKVLAEARKSGDFADNEDFASRVAARLGEGAGANRRPVLYLTEDVLRQYLGGTVCAE